MKRLLAAILMVAWALWLGGLVAMLIFVIQLFKGPRPIAVEAAPTLFRTFAMYQLLVGIIACSSGTLLALLTRRKATAVLTLLMLGSLAAAMLIRSITAEMESIRLAGDSSGPQFKALHGRSSMLYTGSAALLLIAGVGFTLVLPPRQTSPGTAAA